jgi:hypothetical protein
MDEEFTPGTILNLGKRLPVRIIDRTRARGRRSNNLLLARPSAPGLGIDGLLSQRRHIQQT